MDRSRVTCACFSLILRRKESHGCRPTRERRCRGRAPVAAKIASAAPLVRIPGIMEQTPRDRGPSNATQEVANLGVVRPPIVYLACIVAGSLLERAWPLPFSPRALAAPLGNLIVVVAVVLFSYAVAKFRAAGTPVPGNKPATVVVGTGPYRFSRNPIYLAFSLFQLGIAIWVNSLWLIITLILAVALMAYVVIPREERYLEGRFGAQYLDYKRSVRRWL